MPEITFFCNLSSIFKLAEQLYFNACFCLRKNIFYSSSTENLNKEVLFYPIINSRVVYLSRGYRKVGKEKVYISFNRAENRTGTLQ